MDKNNEQSGSVLAGSVLERGSLPLWEAAFIVMGLILTLGAFRPEALPGEAESGSPVFRLMALFMYAASAALIALRPNQFFRVMHYALVPALLMAYIFLSSLWSVAPDFTFRRAIAILGTTVFALYLASRLDFHSFLRLLSMAIGVTIVVSLLLFPILPHYVVHSDEPHTGLWKGVFGFKNTLGRTMVLGLYLYSFLSITTPAYRNWNVLFAVLSAILLVLTGSGSAIAISLIAATFLAVFYFGKFFDTVLWLLMTLLFFVSIYLVMTVGLAFLAGLLGKDPTLTGRSDIWSGVLYFANQKWLTGWGYQAFFQSSWEFQLAHIIHMSPGHSHNDFIEVYLDLGLIGSLLNLYLLLSLIWMSRKMMRQTHISFAMRWWGPFVFVYLMSYGSIGSAFLVHNGIQYVILIVAILHLNLYLSASVSRPTVRAARGPLGRLATPLRRAS